MYKREIKALLVMTLVLFNSACSVKFAYNNMDRFVRWQVNDYLDLNTAQRAYFKEELAALIVWHRRDHLPLYADYFEGLALQYSDGVSEAQIQALFEQFMVWGLEIEDRAMPMTIHLLKSLSDEQVASLPVQLERSNLELMEDEMGVSLEEAQTQWAEDIEQVMTRFTGRLDRRQKAYISFKATAYQPERALWAEYRRRWQADMMRLLEARHDVDFGPKFHDLAKSREAYYGPEYTTMNNENIALSREVSAYLLSNLNERQSRRLTESIEELARDFSDLATQGAD